MKEISNFKQIIKPNIPLVDDECDGVFCKCEAVLVFNKKQHRKKRAICYKMPFM